MKTNRFGSIRTKVFTMLTVLGLVAVPLMPMPALATDSLDSRGCETNAVNLVQNPGFNDSNQQFLLSPIQYIDAQNVTGWGSSAGNRDIYRPITYGGGSIQIAENSYFSTAAPHYEAVYEGARAATLPGFHAPANYQQGRPTIYGTLSTTPASQVTAGVKYRLSARIYKDDQAGSPPASIEMRLRSAADGAESVQTVKTAVTNASSWVLVAGTITADKSYDQILLRYWKDGDWVLLDDVVVCKAAPTPPLTWQQILALTAGGLSLLVLLGGLLLEAPWRPRSSKGSTGHKVKSVRVAAGDVNGDGFADKILGSPEYFSKNKIVLAVAGLVLIAATVYVATANGGVWKRSTVITTPKPTTTTKATSKTCKDKATVKSGYKLFRSETYKYCIQYPTAWPVEQTKADMVTFGTVNPEPTPGWLKVTHFKDKSTATRTEEIMSNFREPAGPCTTSEVTVGGVKAKKLDCIGAFDGEDHVFILLNDQGSLIALSYIVGSDTTKTLFEAEYKVMVESFLTDNIADQAAGAS